MSEQERLARLWAERNKACEVSSPEIQAAADYILATTAPQTVADVEWDDEKHHLAGAVFQNAGTDTTAEVVMFQKDWSGAIIAVDVENGRPLNGDAAKYTPNGKRYELREITEPDHPEVLKTVEDYQNAPVGTVAMRTTSTGVDMKYGPNDWRYTGISGSDTDFDMAGSIRRVLRWGKGGEA